MWGNRVRYMCGDREKCGRSVEEGSESVEECIRSVWQQDEMQWDCGECF